VSVRRQIAAIALLGAACAFAPAASADGATSASVEPSFEPYRLGQPASATLTVRFAGGAEHVPAPLSAMTLRLPAGLTIRLRGVSECQVSRLRRRGASGCPPTSLIGRGRALLEVHAGSQTLPEQATLSVFRGPDVGAGPTFEVLGQGATPLDERTISTAILEPDSAPYGSKLVVSVPPIPTLTYEPNASFSSLSLTIGNVASGPPGKISVPHRCPRGGLSFAANFSFADHTSTSTSVQLPCPRRVALGAVAGAAHAGRRWAETIR
jgi:hypothetical protein